MRLSRMAVNHPTGYISCRAQALGSALIRAERRESLRATVLAWITPLPDARCISGCAARRASAAAVLSPLASAVSTFLTKVLMRDLRAWLRAVRVTVWRMRLRADAVLAMRSSITVGGQTRTRRQTGSDLAEDGGSTHRPEASQAIGAPRSGHANRAWLHLFLGFNVDGDHQVTHLGPQCIFDPVADRMRGRDRHAAGNH